MKDQKGFTLIELLAVIVILAIIALIAIPLIMDVIDNAKKGAFKDSAYGIIKAAELDYTQEVLKGNDNQIVYTYENGIETSNIEGKLLNYKGDKPKGGTIIINEEGKIALAIHNGTYCAEKGFDDINVVLNDKAINDCFVDFYIGYVTAKGVNAPRLAPGMIPIKWNGTSLIETTVDDPDWYDYAMKKWANAKTADGSMWVWIPRYTYKISNGWHSSTPGTIDIKFSMEKDDTRAGEISVNNGPTAEASNNNWSNHPAFTFGEMELDGIWIGKFEASNNSNKVKVAPGGTSWVGINISNMFDKTREMELNSLYGWDGSGEGLDTHLIKNNEWGAVTYLSKSIYGKNAAVTVNGSTTAGGGSANAYLSNVDQSTTGNVYGVYDMSGGTWEYVAGYVSNGHGYLTTNGGSIIAADSRYSDSYLEGTTDNQANNYAKTINNKGDAIYETSNSVDGSTAWFTERSYMPYGMYPWFTRGGFYGGSTLAGLFNFERGMGSSGSANGFRPSIAVRPGL